MKKLLPLLLILPVLPMPLPGAVDDKVVEYLRPDEARIAPDGERFLFVVETTSHTQRMEAGCRQTAFDLVFTGVSEQMRTGDTFGVWTFNDEVHTGKFPMTVWDSAQTLELAGRVSGFLKDQKYSHKPNMEALVLSLRSVTEQTGDLNVFLLSSGREPIVGTPYDE